MARASGSSGFELVLIGTAAVVLAAIFVVPYALAGLLYTFPFLIFWLLTPATVGAEPQLVIDPSPHPKLAKLRAQLRYADEQYTNVRYGDWGIRWSDNLDRFEERSIRGRDLNYQLEEWKAESRRISGEIREADDPETNAFTKWSKELRAWHQQHALNAAKHAGWKLALQVFTGVWITAELIGLTYPNFIKLFAFAWNPAPDILHPGVAIGAAAGWAAGLYRAYHPPDLFAERARARIDEYLNAKSAREEAEDSRTAYSSSDEPFEDVGEDRDETGKPDFTWYEVLKVDPQSTVEEIKTAYKRAAMACHPDKVAHMNEQIQQFAKEEMQKLNDAFQQAQTARGF